MTILIAGSTGFLGSFLLKSFLNNGYQVVALKRSTSDMSRLTDHLDQVVCYDVDTTPLQDIFEKHAIDIVINTVTNYGRKNSEISSIVETNLLFGLRLLEESIDANVKAFINTDTLLQRNLNVYALSKAQLVDWMQFLSHGDTKMINIKIEHMYGPQDDANKFVYWLINQLKSDVNKIDLTSGLQKRDFIYIDDIVSAYETIINHLDTLTNYAEFELGSGTSIEVKSFVDKIYSQITSLQTIHTKLNFGIIAYRENENMHMQADISKLKQLGWKPTTSLDEGIKNIINEEN